MYTVYYGYFDEEEDYIFECDADDREHAKEQCYNAYPDCIVFGVEYSADE